MSFKQIRELPSVAHILDELPLPAALAAVKQERDEELAKIFTGASNRFLLIIGPCSAHDTDAVCDYVSRLAGLQEKVRDKLMLIPRIYTNKPRTTGSGYKGMGHQPRHTDRPNISEGLKAIRAMHIRALGESGLSAADEMLYPENYPYLEDVLSYVAIGARSVENQQHRLTISGLDIPSGMKNPTSGDMGVMLNSVQAAQLPHIFTYNRWEVETTGNPLCHCILRGAVDKYGRSIPNYHYDDLEELHRLYQERKLANPAVIVDTNHANSGKKYREQPRIAREIISSKNHSPGINTLVKGLMIESFLVGGQQDETGTVYGQSITDPCLDWEESARLVQELATAL